MSNNDAITATSFFKIPKCFIPLTPQQFYTETPKHSDMKLFPGGNYKSANTGDSFLMLNKYLL